MRVTVSARVSDLVRVRVKESGRVRVRQRLSKGVV